MSACRRLEGHGIHSRDLAEYLLRIMQYMQTSLHRLLRLQRMDTGKAGQGSRFIIHLGIIFHGTGAQRICAVIYPMGSICQLRIMPADIVFRHLGKPQRALSFHGRHHNRYVTLGKQAAASSFHTSFKNQLHLFPTSLIRLTSSSISSFVFFSVVHQRSLPSGKGSPPK